MQREQQVIALLLGRRLLSWAQLPQDAHSGALDQQEQQVQQVQQVQDGLLPKLDEGRIYGPSDLGLPKVCS